LYDLEKRRTVSRYQDLVRNHLLARGENENDENNPLHYQSVRCSDEQLKVKPLLTWRL